MPLQEPGAAFSGDGKCGVCVCSDSREAFGVGLGEAFDGGSGVSLVGVLFGAS